MEPKKLANLSFSQVACFQNLGLWNQDFREITSGLSEMRGFCFG